MATSLSAWLDFMFGWTYTDSDPELSTPRDNASRRVTHNISNGTGSLQSNLMFHDRRRLTPSSPTDLLDLAGVLTDAFGDTLTFTVVKALLVYNLGVPNASPATAWTMTTGEDIEVGAGTNGIVSWFGGASATGNEKIIVRSGGALVLTAPHDGYAITAATADILRISLEGGGSADVDYDLIIMGN
jgi:hypothetical protein